MSGDSPQDWVEAWGTTTALRPATRTVDVHTHLMVPESVELTRPLARPENDPRTLFSSPLTNTLNQEFYRLAQDKYLDAETRIKDMDAMGIDIQLVAITPFQYYYWAEAGLASKVASIQNQRIADLVSSHPNRFIGVGTLPLGHADLAVAEVKRVADLGFPAIQIGADVQGADLDDQTFDPVWAAIEESGLVVILHPAGFTEGRRLTDYYLVNVIGMPLATTVAVSRMILGGVFERFPRLRMLLVHGGGYLAFYSARTDHAFRHRPEMRAHIDRLPSEYLSGLFFDTAVFDPAMVRQLVTRFGADRVLLGTDYPFDMGLTDPLNLIAESGLATEQQQLVAGGNALALLGIDG